MLTTKAPAGHILTYSGNFFDPLNPKIEDINLLDIAHSLANLCRYNGHVDYFYSVAQHSVLVSRQFNDLDLRKWGLLHDATEAYLGDVVAPLKYCGHYDFYLEAEDKLMDIIAERFELSPLEMPDEIDKADKALRGPEMRDLKDYVPGGELNDGSLEEMYKFTIKPWLPAYAKAQFLMEADDLGIY